MDILDSEWLVRMLSRTGGSPAERLMALFAILQDWVDAPHLREAWQHATPPDNYPLLMGYLQQQAAAGSAANPEALAYQVLFMAIGALQEELRSPACGALRHAAQAVQLLVDMELKVPRKPKAKTQQAALATLVLVAALGLLVADRTSQAPVPPTFTAEQPQLTAMLPVDSPNPDEIVALHGSLERIRQGQCMYPQALMLPANQRSIFLENIVDGWVAEPGRQVRELQELTTKVECYYPPVAMTTG